MERRIFGIETEYGVTCTFHGQRRLSPDEVARYLFRKVVAWGRSSNVFLSNGSRLYLDVGSHPEYATAECDPVPQLVAHDRAGERILEGLVVDAERRLEEEGIHGDVYLFKNNTDSAGNSYGCHENFLIERQGDFARQEVGRGETEHGFEFAGGRQHGQTTRQRQAEQGDHHSLSGGCLHREGGLIRMVGRRKAEAGWRGGLIQSGAGPE